MKTSDQTQTSLNLTVAVVLSLLSLWMTVADFSYPGDLLFQTSSSFLISALVFSLLFLAALIVAVFPKRMVIGLNLLLLCRLSYGFPFSIAVDSSTASRITSVLLLLLSLSYLILSLKKSIRIGSRPWVQLKHTLVVLAVWIIGGIASIPVFIVGAGYGVRPLLGEYTELTYEGVTLVERVFEKDGKRVHLVGMMHIGDGNYYRDLKQRMNTDQPTGERRLVLMEGVSDRDQLLPKDFANGTTYAKFASALGLEAQESLEPSLPEGVSPALNPDLLNPPSSITADQKSIVWENADIDISELEPRHQTLLVALLGVFSGGDVSQVILADMGDATGEDLEDLFKNGLIGARNQVLMERFDVMSPDFAEVYIPWGAAHLPDVEKRLVERGYEQAFETKRPIVTFWK